jgi:hypothetical protein
MRLQVAEEAVRIKGVKDMLEGIQLDAFCPLLITQFCC